MAGSAQEKTPGETIRLGADFTQALLTGETISGANIGVSISNALTDAAVSGVLLTPSISLSGNTVRAQFQAGTAGDVYQITFSTGSTSFSNSYQAKMNLIITDNPVGDNLLCDLDEYKRFLKIDADDTSDDALLNDCLLAATKYIQTRTGRHLFLKRYVEDVYIDCEDHSLEWAEVEEYPIQTVDSIVMYSADEAFTETVTDSSSYDFKADEGIIFFRHSYQFYDSPGFSRITYRAGFAKIPDDLRQACKQVAAIMYRNIGREGLLRERLGDYTWETSDLTSIPKSLQLELTDLFVESVVKKYTRRSIA